MYTIANNSLFFELYGVYKTKVVINILKYMDKLTVEDLAFILSLDGTRIDSYKKNKFIAIYKRAFNVDICGGCQGNFNFYLGNTIKMIKQNG